MTRSTARRLGLVVGLCVAFPALGQDFSMLRINEVIAANRRSELLGDHEPLDVGFGTPDIVEIYNAGSVDLEIGRPGDTAGSLALTDRVEFLPPTLQSAPPYNFASGSNNIVVRARSSILVFCDGNSNENDCEPHATFDISSDGEEPITLWGPVVGTDGEGNPIREVIDQVWLPPLRDEVSFGRFPDGAGPAPVSLEETLDHLVFNPPGTTTFGSCVQLPISCSGQNQKRRCEGGPNNPGANLDPRVSRADESTNTPLAGEAVGFVVRVRDDKEPAPPNIQQVEIVYRLDGGPWQATAMTYDAVSGLQDGSSQIPPRPLDRWTFWTGEIPGQPARTRVELYFRVTDEEGASSTRPLDLCEEDQGPCDRQFGGDGCVKDPLDPLAQEYLPCEKPWTYLVGYEPEGPLANVLITEVMPAQATVLMDPTATDAALCSGAEEDRPKYCCTTQEIEEDPACGFEDWVEILNAGSEPVDLSGCWLSERFFDPRRWQFPPGSVIPPETRFLVWLDNDGSKCPNPSEPNQPDFWECPDPNNPAELRFHANFALAAEGDQVFLFDREEEGFGLIHGLDFGAQVLDVSLSLCPDGERSGTFISTPESGPDPVLGPTPGASNECPETPDGLFIRGDANQSCRVDLSDGVFILNVLFRGTPNPGCNDAMDTDDTGRIELTDAVFLFRALFAGGRLPPPPGHLSPGVDPTDDGLGPCIYNEACLR